MISHRYKCIFIHIPRVGGSSLENWICGSDWWSIEKETKHLIASQAKELYKDYWDEYFTFAFVRNPWDRVVSMLKFQRYFGIRYQRRPVVRFLRRLNFEDYKLRFGNNIVLEHDYRFHERKNIISNHHHPGQVYGNILDEKLDFIGRYENFTEDCLKLQEMIGIQQSMAIHIEQSERKRYQDYYNRKSIEEVRRLYAKDIERFKYEY